MLGVTDFNKCCCYYSAVQQSWPKKYRTSKSKYKFNDFLDQNVQQNCIHARTLKIVKEQDK